MMRKSWQTSLLTLMALVGTMSLRTDAWGEPEGAATESAAPATPGATATSDVPPAKSKKYRRSRLTRDESEAEADRRRMMLTTGEDKAVDLDFDALDGKGIAVGNPQIVIPQLVKIGEKRQIVFKPLKAGETTVTLRDQDGSIKIIFTVRVSGSNLLRTAGEIRDLLRDVEGIDVRLVGQKIVVDGQVLVPVDYGRLLTVVQDEAYAKLIINLVQLSPLAMQILAKKIMEEVSSFAPNVKVRVINGVLTLEGTVDNQEAANRAMEVAKLYLPEAKPGSALGARDPGVQTQQNRKMIQNFILVNAPPPRRQEKLVRVTVHFVELSKDYSKTFGFKWEPGFTTDPTITIGQSGTGGTGASSPSFTATISSLLPKLQNAQDAGYARILKTGTVVVRSGQFAELNEETEIPFLRAGPNGQPVGDKVTVGLSLGVTPQILGQSEDIQMDLEMNQKSQAGNTAAGVPATTNHKVKTKLYVKSTDSAAIAGINSSDIGTDFNKDDPSPGTFAAGTSGGATTSSLFKLLHSKKYHKKKSQFVIFVTPQIIDNASDGTEDLKKNFRVKVK